jgi:hypothetical protein
MISEMWYRRLEGRQCRARVDLDYSGVSLHKNDYAADERGIQNQLTCRYNTSRRPIL